MLMEFNFIIDSFTLRRGAPAMLELYCVKCNSLLIFYQKDGPGPLLRCYWDRIHGPANMKNLNSADPSADSLTCPLCRESIGIKSLYEKEQRLAFVLIEGSFLIKEIR